MMSKWLFVVSISESVGRGHLNRSIALANVISKRVKVEFYSDGSSLFPRKVKKENPKLLFRNIHISEISLEKYDGVVIDIKPLNLHLIRKLSKISNSSIISDFDKKISHIKTIISPSLQKRKTLANFQTALLGKKYFLILDKYKKFKHFVHRDEVHNIFINFGYIDSKQLSIKVLRLLDNLNYNYNVVVLIGKNTSMIKKIKKSSFNFNLKVKSGISNLEYYYKKTDLCIGAGGVGMIERFMFGIPSIIINTSKDQNNAVNEAKNLKAAVLLNYNNIKEFDTNLKRAIRKLLKNDKARKKLSHSALINYDSEGTERVAKYLLNRS